MKKIIALALLYAVLLPSFCLAGEIQVVDQAGRTVAVNQPVKRVVTTFIPSTIFALSAGLKDELVGASNKDGTSSIYEALTDPNNKPVLVGNRSVGLSLETIASLKPDLVIMYGQKDGVRIADKLTDLGIPAIIIMPESMNDMIETMALIGKAAGKEAHTDKVVSAMKKMKQLVENQTKEKNIPTTYYAANNLLRTVSGDMLQNEMIHIGGGQNVSANTKGFFVNISREQLLAWSPEVIICSDRLTDQAIKKLYSPEFSSIKAIKTKNIYRVPEETYWDFPSPLAMAGMLWMSSKIQPDSYKDVNIQKEINQFYDILFGAGFSASNPKVVGMK